MPLTVGGCKQSTSCKDRSDKLESHQRGFKPRRSFYMQETVNWSSELTLSREKVVMSEEWKAQYNKAGRLWFFGGRCSRKFSEPPLRPDSPLPVRPLNLMTFATGETPCAGSRHLRRSYGSEYKGTLRAHNKDLALLSLEQH